MESKSPKSIGPSSYPSTNRLVSFLVAFDAAAGFGAEAFFFAAGFGLSAAAA